MNWVRCYSWMSKWKGTKIQGIFNSRENNREDDKVQVKLYVCESERGKRGLLLPTCTQTQTKIA
jgi:hypothetical protein